MIIIARHHVHKASRGGCSYYVVDVHITWWMLVLHGGCSYHLVDVLRNNISSSNFCMMKLGG